MQRWDPDVISQLRGFHGARLRMKLWHSFLASKTGVFVMESFTSDG